MKSSGTLIKKASVAIAIIICIVSVIVLISYFNYFHSNIKLIAVGVMIFSSLSCLFLYGFGELIENTARTLDLMKHRQPQTEDNK